MAFFLKNGQGLLLVGQIILYIFLKIELNLPRHVRDEVLTRTCGCLVTFESRP